MSDTTLAIIVPLYNERSGIEALFERLHRALESLPVRYEVICVDDGSTDGTLQWLEEAARHDCRIKVIALSRNFGKEAALTCAIDHVDAEAVIPIDADLQDPPELIAGMFEKWREGYDVVYARRASRRSDTALKERSAGLFYRVFNALSEVKIPDNVGDFRLMDRRVVEAVRRLPERDRFMKGLFCWPGFRTITLDYERPARGAGTSKFSYWRLWNFALSGITSFSTLPIRAGVYLGLAVAFAAFCFGLWIIAKTLITGVDTPGYASLMVVILFLGGVQLFFLGLLGEYIGRIFIEVKGRPVYLVERTIGFDDERSGV